MHGASDTGVDTNSSVPFVEIITLEYKNVQCLKFLNSDTRTRLFVGRTYNFQMKFSITEN